MIDLVQKAALALRDNDPETLEAMVTALQESGHELSEKVCKSDRERAALRMALLTFERQVLAARANIRLRERLLGQTMEAEWAR